MAKAYDARHLSNNKSYEVQRSNHFEVIIPGLGEDFTLLVSRCNLPEVNITPTELPYGNTKVKVAGLVEYGEGSLEVRDSIVKDTELKISKWQDQIYNKETGKMGWASDYKRDCKVNQYAPDGTYVRSWVLEGAWPSTVTYGEMDYTNGEAKPIAMTLQYDQAKIVR